MYMATELTKLVQDQVYYAYQLNSYIIDTGLTLLDSNDSTSFFFHLFSISSCSSMIEEHFKALDSPILVSDKMGFSWLCVPVTISNFDEHYYQLNGPFFTIEANETYLRSLCVKLRLSDAMSNGLLMQCKRIPTISLHYALRIAVAIHFGINHTTINYSDIPIINEAVDHITTPDWEERNYHGTWELEQNLLKAIQNGDWNGYVSAASANTGTIGTLSNDNPLRQAQNESIIFVALAIRASVFGGLSPEHAYSISDYYIQRIESCNTIKEVESYSNDVIQTLISRVHAIRKSQSKYGNVVSQVMEYISMHLTEKIVLKEMAAELGYATYYLSNLFQKETGQSVNVYIKKEKIEMAKKLLLNKQLGIAEISDRLAFSSPSFFSATFLQYTGLTPKEFRMQCLKQEE